VRTNWGFDPQSAYATKIQGGTLRMPPRTSDVTVPPFAPKLFVELIPEVKYRSQRKSIGFEDNG
jgi:hypothetical protein